MRYSLDKNLSAVDLIRLVTLFEVYGLYDCADEIFSSHAADLKYLIPVTEIRRNIIDAELLRENKYPGTLNLGLLAVRSKQFWGDY